MVGNPAQREHLEVAENVCAEKTQSMCLEHGEMRSGIR